VCLLGDGDCNDDCDCVKCIVSVSLCVQQHAYPADELMPLSCKGRYRGSEPSRGDVDDALGK